MVLLEKRSFMTEKFRREYSMSVGNGNFSVENVSREYSGCQCPNPTDFFLRKFHRGRYFTNSKKLNKKTIFWKKFVEITYSRWKISIGNVFRNLKKIISLYFFNTKIQTNILLNNLSQRKNPTGLLIFSGKNCACRSWRCHMLR